MSAAGTFADHLKAARERLGLTQAQLAERLGVTRSYVGQMESGALVPTLDKIHEQALRLGVDPHALDPRLASTRRRGRRDA